MDRHPDLASLAPDLPFTRRDVLVTALATGFALAVRPVSAATITTDATGLVAGEVKVKMADGVVVPAYRAKPAGRAGAKHPTVLVVQEIFGVHEHIRDVCRRLAKHGYYAIAPEMFARQGDVSKLSDVRQIIDTVVSKVPDAQVLSDLDATLAWAAAADGADASRAAVTGFCWGGRITWLYAAHNPRLAAGVAWYGRLVGEPNALQPVHPVDVAAKLTVPVLGLYGGADQGIPLDTVEKMRAALRGSTSGSEIVVFDGAPHGFHADYRPSYREETAREAWGRALAWLADHGVAVAGAAAKQPAGAK